MFVHPFPSYSSTHTSPSLPSFLLYLFPSLLPSHTSVLLISRGVGAIHPLILNTVICISLLGVRINPFSNIYIVCMSLSFSTFYLFLLSYSFTCDTFFFTTPPQQHRWCSLIHPFHRFFSFFLSALINYSSYRHKSLLIPTLSPLTLSFCLVCRCLFFPPTLLLSLQLTFLPHTFPLCTQSFLLSFTLFITSLSPVLPPTPVFVRFPPPLSPPS